MSEKLVPLKAHVTERERDQFQALAYRNHRSVSQMLRLIVQRVLSEKETA